MALGLGFGTPTYGFSHLGTGEFTTTGILSPFYAIFTGNQDIPIAKTTEIPIAATEIPIAQAT